MTDQDPAIGPTTYQEVDRLPETAVATTFDRGTLAILHSLAADGVHYMLERGYGDTYIVKLQETVPDAAQDDDAVGLTVTSDMGDPPELDGVLDELELTFHDGLGPTYQVTAEGEQLIVREVDDD